ncbi:hypothetical protein [Streptomyces sp. NPDC020362]|uniref:hypothetical protein n=1 Tax=unclassified Streptomyces TaxID=2593676 RepID=UPI0034079DF0
MARQDTGVGECRGARIDRIGPGEPDGIGVAGAYVSAEVDEFVTERFAFGDDGVHT